MKAKVVNLLVVLILFPLLYIGLSLTPLSKELFVEKNENSYFIFWGTVMLLHWITLFITLKLLRRDNYTLKDIGYNLSKIQTLILILSFAVMALLVFGFTEMSLNYTNINQGKLMSLGGFFPKTTHQRIFFIFIVFTAGFCEEIIYRGFAITQLVKSGLNKWLAIVPAGISFVFIHGIIGFSQFWFYFIYALVLGAIFTMSKRLLPVIIIHLLFDLMAMMAIFQAVN